MLWESRPAACWHERSTTSAPSTPTTFGGLRTRSSRSRVRDEADFRMPQITIREALQSDLAAVIALERGTEGAPHWPLGAYEAILRADSTNGFERKLFVAEMQPSPGLETGELRVAGFVVFSFQPATGAGAAHGLAEVESITVSADFRRRGFGKQLCLTALEWCRHRGASSVELEVRAGSAGAMALYRELGFLETGRRRQYYSDPQDDALLLRLDLF